MKSIKAGPDMIACKAAKLFAFFHWSTQREYTIVQIWLNSVPVSILIEQYTHQNLDAEEYIEDDKAVRSRIKYGTIVVSVLIWTWDNVSNMEEKFICLLGSL